jgi:hypothetical protein
MNKTSKDEVIARVKPLLENAIDWETYKQWADSGELPLQTVQGVEKVAAAEGLKHYAYHLMGVNAFDGSKLRERANISQEIDWKAGGIPYQSRNESGHDDKATSEKQYNDHTKSIEKRGDELTAAAAILALRFGAPSGMQKIWEKAQVAIEDSYERKFASATGVSSLIEAGAFDLEYEDIQKLVQEIASEKGLSPPKQEKTAAVSSFHNDISQREWVKASFANYPNGESHKNCIAMRWLWERFPEQLTDLYHAHEVRDYEDHKLSVYSLGGKVIATYDQNSQTLTEGSFGGISVDDYATKQGLDGAVKISQRVTLYGRSPLNPENYTPSLEALLNGPEGLATEEIPIWKELLGHLLSSEKELETSAEIKTALEQGESLDAEKIDRYLNYLSEIGILKAYDRKVGSNASSLVYQLSPEHEYLRTEFISRRDTQIINDIKKVVPHTNGAANALYAFLNQKENPIEIKLGDKILDIGSTTLTPLERVMHGIEDEEGKTYVDGKGGLKKAFGMPDGRVFLIPNMDTISIKSPDKAEGLAKRWNRVIKEEKMLSDAMRNIGIEAQEISIEPLKVGEHEVPVMVAPRFKTLSQNGLEILDRKNRDTSEVSTMLFGNSQNIEDAEYLQSIMQNLVADSATLIEHGYSFGSDTLNLAIRDSSSNPSAGGVLGEGDKKLRLFLFDFSQKESKYTGKKIKVIDENGEFDSKEIRILAENYIKQSYNGLKAVLPDVEIEEIIQKDNNYSNLYDVEKVLDKSFSEIRVKLVDQLEADIKERLTKLPKAERKERFGVIEAKKEVASQTTPNSASTPATNESQTSMSSSSSNNDEKEKVGFSKTTKTLMGMIGLGGAAYAVAGGEKETEEKQQQAQAKGEEFKPKKRWFMRALAAVGALLALDVAARGDNAILGAHTAKYLNSGKSLGGGFLGK